MAQGPRYNARQNDDGTWDIFDVPVFAEVPAGARANDEPVDAEWMRAAIQKARLRESEGYKPPLHINHHDEQKDTHRAGSFRLRRVASIQHDGQRIDALFADLESVPQWVFSLVKRGELPYRSVEVFDWDKPEINSLALLHDEVPFFRFPNLEIGDEKPNPAANAQAEVERVEESRPALAFTGAAPGGTVLFRFQEVSTMTEAEKPVAEETASEVTLESMAKSIESLAAKIDGLEAQFKSKAQDDDDGDDDDEEQDGTRKPADLAKASEGDDPMTMVARLAGEVEALKATNTAREKKEATGELVAAAIEQLEGYEVSPETRARLHTFAEAGKPVLDEFVASFKATTPKETPGSLDDFATSDHEELVSYANQGPEALAAARDLSDKFDHLKRFGVNLRSSREDFIRNNLRANPAEVN